MIINTSFWSSRVHPASRSMRGSSLDCSSNASCLFSTIVAAFSTRMSACFIFCLSTSVTRSTYLKQTFHLKMKEWNHEARCETTVYRGDAWMMKRCCIRREVRRPSRSWTTSRIFWICSLVWFWMMVGADWNWLIAITSTSSPISVTRWVRNTSSWTSTWNQSHFFGEWNKSSLTAVEQVYWRKPALFLLSTWRQQKHYHLILNGDAPVVSAAEGVCCSQPGRWHPAAAFSGWTLMGAVNVNRKEHQPVVMGTAESIIIRFVFVTTSYFHIVSWIVLVGINGTEFPWIS